jgi:MYXO-CTERM domain-containing protein
MRALHFVVPVIAVVLAACGSAADDSADVRAVTEPIIGGTPSTAAQDATVFISLNDGFCTGSLITPNLVLTARHCVSQLGGNTDCGTFTSDDSPTSMQIVLGVTASESANPTPVAHGIKLYHETNNSGCSYDIALIQLDHDLMGAAIAPLRFTQATTADVGTAIGYGDGDDRGHMTNGRYQRTGIAVSAVGPANYTYKTKTGQSIPLSVEPGEIITGESTCFGDSGGPLLDSMGRVMAVTSRGVDNYCIDRPSVWSDVYSHLAMIQNAATMAGHPLAAMTGGTSSSGGTSGSSGGSSGSGTSGSSGTPSGSGGTSGSMGSKPAPGGVTPPVGGPPMGTNPGNDPAGAGSSNKVETVETSGCSASPSHSASDKGGLALAALGLFLVLAGRRRR